MYPLLAIVALLGSSPGTALILPGQCPQHNQSRFPSIKGGLLNPNYKILLSIPFTSGTKSLMFLEDISELNPVPFINLNHHLTERYPKMTIYQIPDTISRWSPFEPTPDNQSLTTTATFILEKCRNLRIRLSEVIKVWLHEDFLFLWSCEQLESGEDHDEAALVLLKENSPDQEEKLEELGPKYLGQTLWGSIDRKNSPSDYLYEDSEFLVTCRSELSLTLSLVYQYAGLLVAGVIVLMVLWYAMKVLFGIRSPIN